MNTFATNHAVIMSEQANLATDQACVVIASSCFQSYCIHVYNFHFNRRFRKAGHIDVSVKESYPKYYIIGSFQDVRYIYLSLTEINAPNSQGDRGSKKRQKRRQDLKSLPIIMGVIMGAFFCFFNFLDFCQLPSYSGGRGADSHRGLSKIILFFLNFSHIIDF